MLVTTEAEAAYALDADAGQAKVGQPSMFTPASAARIAFNIPGGPLSNALAEWSRQSGLQVLRRETDGESEPTTPRVSRTLSAVEALDQLLASSGLKYEFINERTVRISARSSPNAAVIRSSEAGAAYPAQSEPPASGPSAASAAAEAHAPTSHRSDDGASRQNIIVGIPEILVKGSKILNMDIQRSRDDAQPYVIFGRETIERSGATNIEDFLKNRLTMNTVGATNAQAASGNGNMSQINLRGLGSAQTLILVDGHRTASPVALSGTNAPVQTDLNGIPLAAVERIEVLPTTASGIYGGGATGGVVNIVLRKDYAGVDVKVNYGNTFDNDSASRRVDVSTGFNLEDGKTSVLLAGSCSDSDGLRVGDRDLAQRGRGAILANNPSFFFNAATPPLGATTNIRSVNGLPLFGPGTPSFTSVPTGYAGGGGLAPLQANAGKYNLDLADSAQAAGGGGGGANLMNEPAIGSLAATVRRQFTSSLQGFLDLAASSGRSRFWTSTASGTYTLAATAPNNPFGQSVRVTVPLDAADSILTVRNDDRRVVGGVILQLPGQWSAEADYTWEQFRFERSSSNSNLSGTEATPIGAGTLDVMRDTNRYPLDLTPYLTGFGSSITPVNSFFKDATLRFSGPALSLPAGAVVISGLLERRDETFGGGSFLSSPTVAIFYPERSQSIDSVYLEARVPIVSGANRIPGIDALELQLSGRRDDYSVDGAPSSITGTVSSIARAKNESSSTNPTIALRYQPIRDVTLRASFGTGFLAPSVAQLTTSGPIAAGSILDPRRGNERNTTAQAIYGGNADLRPEESKSRSAGLVITPRFAPDLRLSVDYTRIEKTDNISQLAFQDAVNNEAFFPGRITRGPVAPNDPYGVGAITFIDDTSVNLSQAKVAAYDVALDYKLETLRLGRFDFFGLATWQPHYQTQTIPAAPLVENVGVTSSFPLKFKANAGLDWRYGPYQVGWSARYFDSYLVSTTPTVVASQGSPRVPSQTYHDVYTSYRLPRSGWFGAGMFSTTEVQLGIRNLFNHRPPYDANNSTYFYSPYGDPRLSSYYLTLHAGF
ncbi:MAG: TonB-dependent receptor [Gammaproteobacteria bacterium]